MPAITTIDLLDLGQGSVKEKIDHAWESIIDSISDPNVESKAARKMTITITVKPNGERNYCSTMVQVQTSLPPTNAVETAIIIGSQMGKSVAKEYVAQQSTLTFDNK
jgi:hypothetical protein